MENLRVKVFYNGNIHQCLFIIVKLYWIQKKSHFPLSILERHVKLIPKKKKNIWTIFKKDILKNRIVPTIFIHIYIIKYKSSHRNIRHL